MSILSPRTARVNKKLSYAEYRRWSEEERWEIIDGVPYDMSPARLPSRQESKTSSERK